MRVYLAARYSRKDELNIHAAVLTKHGYQITSTWLQTNDGKWHDQYDPVWEGHAIRDIEDIDAADAVVSFTHPRGTPVTGGGRHVEFGYGYAKGKRLIVIGPRENVFHHLPGIEFYESIEEMIEYNKPSRAKKRVRA